MSPVTIKSIRRSAHSLSAKSFGPIASRAIRLVPLSNLLDPENPYEVGTEPGGDQYCEDDKWRLIRTAALQHQTFDVSVTGSASQGLVRPPADGMTLAVDDLLLCKDSNIGASGMVDRVVAGSYFSSGIVRLRPRVDPYLVLALLKDRSFLDQLDLMVPTGATIRHAGNRFLRCLVPDPSVLPERELISTLTEICVRLARAIRERHQSMLDEVRRVHNVGNLPRNGTAASLETVRKNKFRFDAAPYSKRVRMVQDAFAAAGLATFSELGIKSRRGQNLAESVIGRVEYSEAPHVGWYQLIRPMSITNYGTLDGVEYLGTKRKISHVAQGEIIFGTEATFRTFVVTRKIDRCVTNFHGTILSLPEGDIVDACWLRCILEYLRSEGVLKDLAVGGQGGHLSPEYFETIPVPKDPRSVRESIAKFYSSDSEGDLGVVQLDETLRLCSEALAQLLKAAGQDDEEGHRRGQEAAARGRGALMGILGAAEGPLRP